MGLMNLSCEGFLEELASKAAAPGGGGASALVGAAGVALGSMVGSLTVGKKKYAAVEADIIALNVRAEALRKRLEALVQADAEAFLPVAAAYKLPKETPEQQVHKAAVLEKALDRACAVPLEVMTACGEGIALAAEYAEKGSVLARSDAGCAALFCKAAMQAAGLNVKVNTRLMADKAHADALEARAEQLLRGEENGSDLEGCARGGRHERSKRRALCRAEGKGHRAHTGCGTGRRAGG